MDRIRTLSLPLLALATWVVFTAAVLVRLSAPVPGLAAESLPALCAPEVVIEVPPPSDRLAQRRAAPLPALAPQAPGGAPTAAPCLGLP